MTGRMVFRNINSGSSLVAEADVEIKDGIWIKKWLIFKKADKYSSSPPSRSYQDKQGKTKYNSYIGFDNKEDYFKWCDGVAQKYADSLDRQNPVVDDDEDEFKAMK